MHGPGRQPRPRQRLSDAADQVKQIESNAALPPGDVGLDLTRQYYLRVIAARDGSPAAQGRPADRRLRSRHRRHADARDVGLRRHAPAARRARLEGLADRSSAAAPTIRTSSSSRARRCRRPTSPAASPRPASATCASRHRPRGPPIRRKTQIADLTKGGASKLIVDVRRTSGGSLDGGLALARLFVSSGTLACAKRKEPDQGNDRRERRRRQRHAADDRCSSTPARRAPPSSSPSALSRQQARGPDRRAHHRPRRRSRSWSSCPTAAACG